MSDSTVGSQLTQPQQRRKRRCKRMAIDPAFVPPLTPTTPKESRSANGRRSTHYGVRKFSGRFVENFTPGKRKRSKREVSHEFEIPERPIVRPSQLRLTKSESDFEPPEVAMETDEFCNKMEGLNVSSHSSDCESHIYSSDEGRQGDDEFSDWPENEVSLDRMHIETETSSEGEAAQAMQSERARTKLKERIPAREMRAGIRRLGEQRGPAVSIFTSANEKLSRFLQDPGQSELRLHPMQKSERKQLSQLAHLYSLNMRSEGAKGIKCPVLTKTNNTTRAVRIDLEKYQQGSSADVKRLRKTPPPPQSLTKGFFQN
ncbi:hypothetical protein QYM36_013991 [Artemia franciscana]|uniref:R3H domain-containing protein n=2 Tax=Artemia franciscana TaxID=6661 RepID=A0AA88KZT7_ARTSF|nr:hypothetical protein QYM36_013991 [Artemia franciscana]